MKNEMTNTMTNHRHLYKEKEKEKMGGEFKEEKNFTCGKRKN